VNLRKYLLLYNFLLLCACGGGEEDATPPTVTANFTVDSQGVASGEATIQFTSTSSGPVSSWSWTFGDGSISSVENPTHTYTSDGVYNPTLTVQSAAGQSDVFSSQDTKIYVGPPIAGLTFFPGEGTATYTVGFLDGSIGEPSGWYWEFGDGSISVSQNPSHAYSIPGTYTPQLTVYNPIGTPSVVYASPDLITVDAPEGGGGGQWDDVASGEGNYDGGSQGDALGSAGDMDGDGVDDYLVGEPGANGGDGATDVYSGATNDRIFTLEGGIPDGGFGSSLFGVGDYNADNIPDFLVGAPYEAIGLELNAGRAYLVSGADGTTLMTMQAPDAGDGDIFGSVVIEGADARPHAGTPDGILDFVVSAPGWDDASGNTDIGKVYCFDAVTGSVLFEIEGPPMNVAGRSVATPGPGLGLAMAKLGDVNGGTNEDLALGIPFADVDPGSGAVDNAGEVWIVTGNRGILLMTLQDAVPTANNQFGLAITRLNDLDYDNVDDLAVGAPGTDIQTFIGPLLEDAGNIIVYSGSTGTVLAEIPGSHAGSGTGSNLTAGDVNGDGVSDIGTGSKKEDLGILGGTTFVFEGFDVFDPLGQNLLFHVDGDADSLLGTGVAMVSDLNADGRQDMLSGAPGTDSTFLTDSGAFEGVSFDSYITTDAVHVGSKNGFILNWTVDFPTEFANMDFKVIASTTGTGPTILDGLPIPVTNDQLFQDTLNDPVGNGFPASFEGTLDEAGDWIVTISASELIAQDWHDDIATGEDGLYWCACVIFSTTDEAVITSGYIPIWIHDNN